ncbi:MAG: FtsX-like permease family protein [Actinobacteria bacterium]|nr:FtsX-like permease family protein [Actinomycetota bacterium]
MLRLTLRDIRTHWVRFILSILAVFLATAFVAGTFTLTRLLGDTIDQLNTSVSSADVYVRGLEREGSDGGGPGGGPFGSSREVLDIGLADDVADVDGVAAAQPELFGIAYVVGSDGLAVTNSQAPSFGWALWEELGLATALDGRLPTGAREIALDSPTLEKSGFAIGDTAQVSAGQLPPFDATIVGEVEYSVPLLGATILVISEDIAREAFAPEGTVQQVAIMAEEGADPAEVAGNVSAALGDGVEVVTGEEIREEQRSATEQALGFVETIILVFALIALFVGSFLILNTFAMLVRQRQREFALLRAIGASPRQVLGTLLAQAALIGLVGASAGIAGGIALVAGVQRVLVALGIDFSGASVSLPVDRAITVVVAAVVVTSLAAIIPARDAAETAPVEAMRPENPKAEKSLVLRAIVSGVILLAGIGAVVYAVLELSGPVLGVGAFAVLLGVLGMAPVFAPAVLGTLALPLNGFRPVGRLARGNVMRNPRRTAATAAALTIGMALVSVAAVVASSATASTRTIVEDQVNADLVVTSATSFLPEQVVPLIESVESVDQSAVIRLGFGNSPDLDEAITLSDVPFDAMGTLYDIPLEAGSLPASPEEILVQLDVAESLELQPGDTFGITTLTGSERYTVAGIANEQFFGTDVIASTEVFEAIVDPERSRLTGIGLTARDGDVEALRTDLAEAVRTFPFVSVLSGDELGDAIAEQVNTLMAVLYAMLGLSLVIAVLSIVNTLALSVIERTREIGLMRAVGLGRGQLGGVITVESVLTALFGTLTGMVIGVSLASTLPTIFKDDGLRILDIPWGQLLIMLGLTVVIGVLAAIWPAIRAARLPVLDAVSSE